MAVFTADSKDIQPSKCHPQRNYTWRRKDDRYNHNTKSENRPRSPKYPESHAVGESRIRPDYLTISNRFDWFLFKLILCQTNTGFNWSLRLQQIFAAEEEIKVGTTNSTIRERVFKNGVWIRPRKLSARC